MMTAGKFLSLFRSFMAVLRIGIPALALLPALWTASVANDLPAKRPSTSGVAAIPANACKAPSAITSVPGFDLACGKRIRAGIFLGSALSPVAGGLADCATRCRANAKCLAFSLDNRDNVSGKACSLYGSTEGVAEAADWILGVRTEIQPDPITDVSDLVKVEDAPIAVGPRNGRVVGGDNGQIKDSSQLARPRRHMYHKRPDETHANVFGKTDFAKSPHVWSKSVADPFGAPPQPTADMKDLQPVYFITDRTRKAGPLVEASFTDDSAPDMTYGYAIVSIPKSHVFGNVERPKWRWLKLSYEKENDADHFRIKTLTALDRAAFVGQLKDDKESILLFIHGYNVPFSDAVFSAAQIAYDANFPGSVLAFSWPSAGNLFKYDKDRESAAAAAPHLAEVFSMLSGEVGKKNVYIVAHSMGNQVLVSALERSALSKANITISELVMAAPDVALNVYLSKAKEIQSVAKNITLYASSADKALNVSGMKSFVDRIGFVTPAGPHRLPGIEIIDVTAVGDDMFGLNHSTFASSRAVLNDLALLLRSMSHLPPDARTPTLKFMPNKANIEYWLYPP